jgi:hypothetical protein
MKILTIDQAEKLIQEGKAKPIGYRQDRGAMIVIIDKIMLVNCRRIIYYYR